MSGSARTVIKCDYRECPREFTYNGIGYNLARRRATEVGWETTHPRNGHDYCPDHTEKAREVENAVEIIWDTLSPYQRDVQKRVMERLTRIYREKESEDERSED